jgi:hypothetical protein
MKFQRKNGIAADLALRCCSAALGHARMGTPAHTVSRIEFHPQWLKNPPVARCFRICICGAHPEKHIPLPLILSSKPGGKNSGSCRKSRVYR